MARRPLRPLGHFGGAQRASQGGAAAGSFLALGLRRPMKGTSMDRRRFCAGIVAGALPLASAQAQTWPDKPENIIGAQAAARSAPDGYTFYFATTAALVSNVYLFKQLPYDPVKDFDPVAFVATSPFGLMVPGPSPIRSIDEFIAASKAAPDKLTLANEGPRTLGGMAARLFNARAGIRNNLVPYASASVGIQDALAGRVDALIVDLAATTQHIKHGDLRLLATTSAGRIKGWDSTPALSEKVPGFDMPGWFAVVAPADTPKAVIARVNRDINAALAEPELVERISAIGPIVDPGKSPEQVADFLRQEHQRWSEIAKEIGLLPE